jgi:hypothetical protein
MGHRDRAAAARAAARSDWEGKLTDLAHEGDRDFVEDPDLRVRMMWPLMLDAWKMTGAALPSYERDTMPGTIWRAGESPPEHAA